MAERSIDQRLRERFDVNPETGCWECRAARDYSPYVYAQIAVLGRKQMAHRVAYETWVGPIPEGMEIDHTCQVRACINPGHLETVTHAENIRRAKHPRFARKSRM